MEGKFKSSSIYWTPMFYCHHTLTIFLSLWVKAELELAI